MVYAIFILVSFGASIIGAICGIGGGVIIKPTLDAFGLLEFWRLTLCRDVQYWP